MVHPKSIMIVTNYTPDSKSRLKMGPIVSVIMPTRGRTEFVKRAVSSVLEQTFANFELLILDNSSIEDREIILEISKGDSRIEFIDRGNIGVTAARKRGAMMSRGKLFALLDSDDYWKPERLEKHIEMWTKNRIGLSWDRWREVGDTSKEFPQFFREGVIKPPGVAIRLYNGNFIHASAGIVLTAFARQLGFPLTNILSSDWPLFMRAGEYYSAYFLSDSLSYNEKAAPDRISKVIPSTYFDEETRTITRWFLLNRPSIYGIPFLKKKLAPLLGKVPRNALKIWTQKYFPTRIPANLNPAEPFR
jgi:glycosyltransferase involved in cell wall biosynthesis